MPSLYFCRSEPIIEIHENSRQEGGAGKNYDRVMSTQNDEYTTMDAV